MADIVISEFIDAEPVERLTASYSVHADPELWSKRPELEQQIAQALAILVRNRTQIDAALISKAPNLRVVGRLGVGLDNIDLEACRESGIKVCPAIGANAVAVAEYVIATALMLMRRGSYLCSERLMAGEWPRQMLGTGGYEAEGKTLGLIGFGSIAQVTAAKAQGLGLKTIAYHSSLPDDDPAWRGTERVSLADLLARADIVSVHCPLTPQTRGLIGAAEIAAMKPGALLINSARGGIIAEAALAVALRSGHLGGAALDVFATEPVLAETGALFAGLPNVILTPHIAGITAESNRRISQLTVENVLRALEE